jgi:hypothetical protein
VKFPLQCRCEAALPTMDPGIFAHFGLHAHGFRFIKGPPVKGFRF